MCIYSFWSRYCKFRKPIYCMWHSKSTIFNEYVTACFHFLPLFLPYFSYPVLFSIADSDMSSSDKISSTGCTSSAIDFVTGDSKNICEPGRVVIFLPVDLGCFCLLCPLVSLEIQEGSRPVPSEFPLMSMEVFLRTTFGAKGEIPVVRNTLWGLVIIVGEISSQILFNGIWKCYFVTRRLFSIDLKYHTIFFSPGQKLPHQTPVEYG